MDLRVLNKICFTISIVSILVSVVIALSMIWTPGINETMWRLLGTVGIVFLGSSATLSVSKAFGSKAAASPRQHDSK